MKVTTFTLLDFKMSFSVLFFIEQAVFQSVRNTLFFDAFQGWPIGLPPYPVKIRNCRAFKFDFEVEYLN